MSHESRIQSTSLRGPRLTHPWFSEKYSLQTASKKEARSVFRLFRLTTTPVSTIAGALEREHVTENAAALTDVLPIVADSAEEKEVQKIEDQLRS